MLGESAFSELGFSELAPAPVGGLAPPAYFPHNYFAAKYFAPRYFPPTAVVLTGGVSQAFGLKTSSGQLGGYLVPQEFIPTSAYTPAFTGHVGPRTYRPPSLGHVLDPYKEEELAKATAEADDEERLLALLDLIE